MKIVAGNIEIAATSGFEDFIYEQDRKRAACRLKLNVVPGSEELTALLSGQPLVLSDDHGGHISSFEGYNAVLDCTLTLVKETQTEQELAALQAELSAVTAEKEALAEQNTLLNNQLVSTSTKEAI